ncbi:MAG: hypothetical protein AAGA77_14540 [Bacteroidota bacterium]
MNKLKILGLLVFFVGILSSCNKQEFNPLNEEAIETRSSSSGSPILDMDGELIATVEFSIGISDADLYQMVSGLLAQNGTEASTGFTLNSNSGTGLAVLNAYAMSSGDVENYNDNLPQAVKIYCNYSTGMSDCFGWYRHALAHDCTLSHINTSSTASNSGTVWMNC